MIDELELVKRVRPEVSAPSPEVRVAARRALDHTIANRAGQRRASVRARAPLGRLVPALGMLVVVGVVIGIAALFLSIHSRKPIGSGSPGGLQLVFRAEPTGQVPHVGPAAMNRTVEGVRQHLDAVLPGARVSSAGDELFVRVSGRHETPGQVVALARESERLLFFYDWEANALTPTGRTVATLLQTKDPSALLISQGATDAGPGAPGAGSMALYPAVQLAAKQSRWLRPNNSRVGPEYFMFGAPGSAACAAAARYYHVAPNHTQHCYLAGPQDTIDDLDLALPPGVSASGKGVQTLTVQQGWVVLQAVAPSFGHGPAWSDPAAQYYVLRDNIALFPNDIANPRPSTSPIGSPDIQFGFTSAGARAFQNLTAQIAHRGALVSGLGQKLFQHFAVALDTQLISVPYIDYQANPFGIPGNTGADIQGEFTTSSARQLATQLRLGALPVHLKLIAIKT